MIMVMITITITISKLVHVEKRALSAHYIVQRCICVHEVRMPLQCNDNKQSSHYTYQ